MLSMNYYPKTTKSQFVIADEFTNSLHKESKNRQSTEAESPKAFPQRSKKQNSMHIRKSARIEANHLKPNTQAPATIEIAD